MDEIETFSNHFSMPLVESGFEVQKCFSEWKRFKFYVKANYKPAEREMRAMSGKGHCNIIEMSTQTSVC